MNGSEKLASDNEDETIEIELDPLVGLVEKTAEDPGAPFAPEVIRGLSDLKHRDRAAFEALRAQLKRNGCRVGALDEALSEEISGGAERQNPEAGRHPTPAVAKRRPVPCAR